MSYCELKIVKNNIVEGVKEFINAHGSAAYVWDAVYCKYVNNPDVEYDSWLMNSDKLWPLWTDSRLPEYQQLVLGSTYDNVIIEPDKLDLMADYFEKFVNEFGTSREHGEVVCHLNEYARLCRDFAKDTDCQGVCFYQMSVSEDPWFYLKPYIEDGQVEHEYLPYDITKGDKHWFLFETHRKEVDRKLTNT